MCLRKKMRQIIDKSDQELYSLQDRSNYLADEITLGILAKTFSQYAAVNKI